MLTLKFFEAGEWEEIFPTRFYDFACIENMPLDEDKLWSVFSNDIKTLQNISLEEYLKTDNIDIPKLAHLYRDLKDGMISPIFFYKNKQRGGLGRGLIVTAYYPDINFRCIVHNDNIGGIEIVHRILEYAINAENKPVASLEVNKDEAYFLKQVEFDDYNNCQRIKPCEKTYVEGNYINNFDNTETRMFFWNLLYGKEVDYNSKDSLKNILDIIVNADIEVLQ